MQKYLTERPNAIAKMMQDQVLNRPLVKGAIAGIVNVPQNFVLSFTINLQARGTSGASRSILHFSSDGSNYGVMGSRCPAVWLNPSSTSLHVTVDEVSHVNWGLNTPELPLNKPTKVSIYAIDSFVVVYFDDKMVHMTSSHSSRYEGPAVLSASDPFHEPAIATLSAFTFKPFSIQEYLSERPEAIAKMVQDKLQDKVLNRQLVKDSVAGIVNVPQNFVLSFTINLQARGTSGASGSILHFSSDGSNYGAMGSRSAAIWLNPSSGLCISLLTKCPK
jgi:hypothetical protein